MPYKSENLTYRLCGICFVCGWSMVLFNGFGDSGKEHQMPFKNYFILVKKILQANVSVALENILNFLLVVYVRGTVCAGDRIYVSSVI